MMPLTELRAQTLDGGAGAAMGEQLFGLVFPHVERLMTSLREVANTNFNDWYSQIIPFFFNFAKVIMQVIWNLFYSYFRTPQSYILTSKY